MPRYVKQMHQRHLQIWYNVAEACTDHDGELRADVPCSERMIVQDYEHQLRVVLSSLSQGKLNTKHGSVRVNCNGVPIGGDTIISSAIALGLTSLPIKQSLCRDNNDYSSERESFIHQLGDDFSDFAMMQWTLNVPNTTVVLFWPEAAANGEKMDTAEEIVRQECGNILYERTVNLTKTGLASLVTHAYGYHGWLEAKIKMLGKCGFLYNG